MPATASFTLLDTALRAAALALLAVLGLLALHGRVRQPLGRVTAALAAGLGLQLFVSAPGVAAQVPAALKAALAAISVGNAVVFWLFAKALVDVRFALRRADILVWATVAGASAVHCALVPHGGGAVVATGAVLDLLPLVFGALALRALLDRWAAVDRGARGVGSLVVGGGLAYVLGQQLLRLGVQHGRVAASGATADTAMLLTLLALVAWRALRLDANGPWTMAASLGAETGAIDLAAPPSPSGAMRSPARQARCMGPPHSDAPMHMLAPVPPTPLPRANAQAQAQARASARADALAHPDADAGANARGPLHVPTGPPSRTSGGPPAGEPGREAASKRSLAGDPADDPLLAALEHLMATQHAYRDEGLGIAALAARLDAPEYRLRRVINGRLGHRNFNAYLNGLRLAEARAALADPARRGLPVLSIALGAGFQSIGPFNRAFKADTGLTPTEFRRQKLADS